MPLIKCIRKTMKNKTKPIIIITGLVIVTTAIILIISLTNNHNGEEQPGATDEKPTKYASVTETPTQELTTQPTPTPETTPTPDILITPEPTSETEPTPTPYPFESTMYDYTYAGMKSAKERVPASEYISIAEYGIYPGSDSSRMAQAITDAAAQGKYLYFPKGTYFIKNLKIYNTPNVKICGDGEDTILKTADDAVGEEKWDIGMGLYNCPDLVIRDITFDGNNEKVFGTTEVGVLQLRIENCENASIYGCRFQNNNSGNINIVGHADKLKIYYCDFLNSDCSILVMPGYITNSYLCNNFVDGQEWEWSEPISLYNAPDDDKPNSNSIISGNDIRNHTQSAGGVFITYPSKNILVLNNYFYNCGAAVGSGSRLQQPDDTRGPSDIVCKNNVIEAPVWHGFALLYAEGWAIQENTITNVTDGFAIYLDQCSDCTILDNTLGGSRVYQVNCKRNHM